MKNLIFVVLMMFIFIGIVPMDASIDVSTTQSGIISQEATGGIMQVEIFFYAVDQEQVAYSNFTQLFNVIELESYKDKCNEDDPELVFLWQIPHNIVGDNYNDHGNGDWYNNNWLM